MRPSLFRLLPFGALVTILAATSLLGYTVQGLKDVPNTKFKELSGSEVVEVNLINPMPMGASLKNCSYTQDGTLTRCNIVIYTFASRYEIRDLDMINKQTGKIVRTYTFEDPLANPPRPEFGEGGSWDSPYLRQFLGPDATFINYRAVKIRSPELQVWNQDDMMQYVLCQAYVGLDDAMLCIRENNLFVCPKADPSRGTSLFTAQRGCKRVPISLSRLFKGNVDIDSKYTSAVTAATISKRPGTRNQVDHYDLILFDDTGRMSVSHWKLTKNPNYSLPDFVHVETEKAKIFDMNAIQNAHFKANVNESRDNKEMLDKWVMNSYLMDQQRDNVKKFTRLSFGQKLRRSYIQSIALHPEIIRNFTWENDLQFPKGSLCFSSGYTDLIQAHYTTCASEKKQDSLIESYHALHYDKNGNGTSFRHLVYQDKTGATFYQRCKGKQSTCEKISIATPPNDIVSYKNVQTKCIKTLVLYDLIYTHHEPGSYLYAGTDRNNVGTLSDQLPFYITAAFGVDTTFYLFTRTNSLVISHNTKMDGCSELVFSTELKYFYAEDLTVPNNFYHKMRDADDVKIYYPHLIDYREFAANTNDSRPSMEEIVKEPHSEETVGGAGGGTNLAAIIIALLLGLIILAGIIYLYCLRTSVDDDMKVTGRKSPRASKRMIPTESLHMPTVRSGMDKMPSAMKSGVISTVKSVKSTKSIKPSKHSSKSKKTARSPLSAQKSKKSIASTKSIKSTKSLGGTRSPKGQPKSPGAAAKSLVFTVKAT